MEKLKKNSEGSRALPTVTSQSANNFINRNKSTSKCSKEQPVSKCLLDSHSNRFFIRENFNFSMQIKRTKLKLNCQTKKQKIFKLIKDNYPEEADD